MQRLLIGLANWLYARCGLRPETMLRDSRGRFRSTKLPPPSGGDGPSPSEMLEHIGVTPKMFRQATPLEFPPDGIDPLDVDAMQLQVRTWAYSNLDHWVHGCGRNPLTALRVLENTWALDRMRYVHSALTTPRHAPAPVRLRPSQRVLTYPAQPLPNAGVPTSGRRSEDIVTAEDALTGGQHSIPEPASVVVNTYDPDHDVVAGLSQKIKHALCPDGFYQGFGNDPQQAIESYYAKNRAEMRSYGGDWAMFGEGCKVYQAFDKQQREYYIARVDGSVDRKAQEASLFGAAGSLPACGTTLGSETPQSTSDFPTLRVSDSSPTGEISGPAARCPDPGNARPPPHYLHILDAP